jgi:hypothetical protein
MPGYIPCVILNPQGKNFYLPGHELTSIGGDYGYFIKAIIIDGLEKSHFILKGLF